MEKMQQPQKFAVNIAEDVLEDLRQRLRRTRWPADFGNDDWRYGVNGDYLRSLVDYWAEGFDWQAQQQAMNRFDHYRVAIDDIPIHFLRQPGKGPSPIPIILTHGWPWTFWDYRDVIEPLSDPARFGGDPADAFEVIVPSLPGFGFSTPLRTTGINFWSTADLWQRLMTDVLGFSRYAAQGGDWGAMITTQLGHKYADSLYGIQVSAPMTLNAFSGARPYDLLGAHVSQLPPDVAAQAIAAERRIASHVTVHLLDPQTLAYAMHDSPVGLLAWLLERLRAWSDCGGDVESRFSRDDILTKATLYWVTESFGTTVRFYAEAARQPWQPSHERMPMVEAPSGVSMFRNDGAGLFGEAMLPIYNLHHLSEHGSGGHFAPMEEPQLLIEDIRSTFRTLRWQQQKTSQAG